MKPELITLILNIVFFTLLLGGFLLGLKGLKKATSSLCSFIVTMVVVIFLAGPVSVWVLGLQFGGRTLETIIIDFINNTFGSSIASNEMAQSLIKGIPIAIVSIVVCLALIFILGTIFKIIGNIIYKLIFGKENKKEIEEVQIVNDVPQMTKKTVKPKKHRLLGGLVGLVHGFLLAFVIFMPIVGIINIVSDIAGVNEVSAEIVENDYILDLKDDKDVVVLEQTEGESSSFELKPAKELLKQYLPAEFYDYAKALDNSILAKVGKVGNMSEFSLNLVVRFDINGQTIKLGQEIRTLVGVYDEFIDFATEASQSLGTSDVSAIFNDLVENPNNYDFDKLNTLVDHLFDSNLVKAIGNDGLKTLADTLVNQNIDPKLQPVLVRLQTAVNNYCNAGYSLKDDAKAVLGAFEISAKNGLIKAIKTEPFDINNVTNILLNEKTDTKIQDEELSKLAGKITSSNLLQKILIEATNYGASYLKDFMNENIKFNNYEKVVLPLIDGSKDIKITSTDLTKVVSDGFKVYNDVIKVLDFNSIKTNIYNAFDYDLEKMLNIVGTEINNVVNIQMFKDSNLFANVCDAMNNSEYSKYVSFNELAKGNNIKEQFANLGHSLTEIKNSNLVSILKNMNEVNQNDSIDAIIDELGAKDLNNTTLSTRILKPMFSCSILKNTMKLGLDKVHGIIESSLDGLVEGETITISEFNTANIMTESFNNQILDIVNKAIDYAKDISVAGLNKDKLMDTLVNSNLTNLGTCLDAVKNSSLFSLTATTGTYVDMLSALEKSNLSDVIDFEVAKNDTYSWTVELTNLQTTINTLNQIKVSTPDGEKGLVTFMLDGGDFNEAYSAINKTNVQNIKSLFEVALIKPLAINVVNTINAKIKAFVGEDLGAQIVDIDTTVNISTQAQQITDVIASAIEIDFNETDLDNIDKTKLNALLSNLETNAKANGVFKESYNALLLKITNMINENIKSFVGNEAGNKITLITQAKDVLAESQNVKNVLNTALDTVKTLKTASFADIDVNVLFALIDALKNNSLAIDGAFANSYNAILVYIVNTVNEQIVNYINDSALTSEVVMYNGNENLISKDDFVRLVVNHSINAFKAIPEGKDLQDIDASLLDNLLNALNSLDYTRKAYNALNNKLANIVIENINSLTGDSVATIASVKDLSTQASDIKNVIDISLKVVPTLKTGSLKIAEMTSENKNNIVQLLNALQNNALKTNGVFENSYNSLVNYVANQNGTTKDYIYENFATDGVVDWNSFVNG